MKASELKTKKVDDLQVMLRELLQTQFDLRMQHGAQQAVKTHLMKETRRDIARVKTVMKQLEIEGGSQS